jgi:hypothetical protein
MNIIITKSFVHPITEAYIDKIVSVGGDVTDLNSVNKFVVELSRIIDPSLWVCWPLRSSQNIGTGTSAFSLGGLGNYTGTLVNGPTWGVDGVTFIASPTNSAITVPTTVNLGSFSIMAVFKHSNFATETFVPQSWDSTGGGLNGPYIQCDSSSGHTRSYTLQTGVNLTSPPYVLEGPPTTFQALSYGGTASTGNRFQYDKVNGLGTIILNGGTNNFTSANSFRLGNKNGVTGNGSGTVAFGFYTVIDIRNFVVQIHEIYKRTLGRGLGLA